MELLAPAGSSESFYAALGAGADAVYLGLDAFNARLRARNFTINSLSALVPYAHSLKRKVYVTLNTLVKQMELERLVHLLYQLDQIGPDALIVTDLGVVEIARTHFPRLALHASTQMVVHNSEGVLAAAELGFKRVVLARELTLDEIRQIASRTRVELELFVHGALCYCISGLCLASSFLGGASGNRGRCTQVCRRPFTQGTRREAFFSTNDLMALAYLPHYRQVGISCLKIEGRMKNAQYVHTVVSAYRRAIDHQSTTDELQSELCFDMGRPKSIFFLSGLRQEGVINTQPFAGTGVYLGTVREVTEGGIILNTEQSVSPGDQLRIHPISGFEGTRALVTSVDRSPEYTVIGLSEMTTVTVGAGVYLTAIKHQSAPTSPSSPLRNKTRKVQLTYPWVARIIKSSPRKKARPPSVAKPRLWVKVDARQWLPQLATVRLDGVVTQLSLTHAQALADDRALVDSWSERLIVEYPPFIPEAELSAWRKVADQLRAAGVRRFMCSHFSQKRLCGSDVEIFADAPIFCLNRYTQKALQALGFNRFSYSLEDDFPNIRAQASSHGMAYQFGRVPLFVSRIRPAVETGALLSDARESTFLTVERFGLYYLVSHDPLCLFHQRRRLDACGISNYLIDLSFYPPDTALARDVVGHFYAGKRWTPSTTFNFKTELL